MSDRKPVPQHGIVWTIKHLDYNSPTGLADPLNNKLLEALKPYGNQDMGLVYKITCSQNQRCYVGQTSGCWFQFVPTVRRFKQHRNALIKGSHKSLLLQVDWALYGEDSFTVQVIEVVKMERFRHGSYRPGYKRLLLAREKYWQVWLNAVYCQLQRTLEFPTSPTKPGFPAPSPALSHSQSTLGLTTVSIQGQLTPKDNTSLPAHSDSAQHLVGI